MIIKVDSPKYGVLEFKLDDVDMKLLEGWVFYAWSTNRHYGKYLLGYSPLNRRSPQRIHRVIMNAKKGDIVDHINGDTSDNTRVNLRITTSTTNNQNARKRKDGLTSRYKGVSSFNGGWRAQIQVHGKKLHLGHHSTEVAAAEAYNLFLVANNIQSPLNELK